MCIPRRSIRQAMLAALGLALFAIAVPSFAADDDPPMRVARLSYLRGDVSFQPAGADDWVQANLNRPLGTGDRLYTDRDSRVELEVGAATLRLDSQTAFDILNLDDNVAQTELTQGVMNLHVRRVFEGQSYEVDTPTLAFVITEPGDYRVDIAPDGSSTMVTVFRGTGDVYGENNASYSVREGQSYRFYDSALRDYEVLDIPRPDDFDSWVDSRNHRYERAVSRQYVSEEVIGYADLDDYGGWSEVPEYGHVWYPTRVDVGWAPYRYGHWTWIDPWGWTWVDNAPWGFAPFHYGRWVYVSNRWGWCPGPVRVRPVYAPALVAFVGGSGWGISVSTGPVGWFPLGPRDVYVPWYRTSRNYFTNVNVRNTTIINNTYITNVYNNYSRGRPITNVNYAYRQNVAAVTAVPRDAFVGARPVNAARVQVNPNQLRNANVVSRVGIAPARESFIGGNPRARATPAAQALDRRVIARTQPPPRPAPVATRIQAIQRNNAQPLPPSQLRRIAPAATAGAAAAGAAAASRAERVQVVGNRNAAKPQPLPARAPSAGQNAAQRAQPQRGNAPTPATPNARTPATPPARGGATAPSRGETAAPTRGQPHREAPATREQAKPSGNALPSSRFAPRAGQPPRSAGEAAPRSTTPSRSTGGTPPQTQRGSTAAPRTPAPSTGAGERRSATPPARSAPESSTRSRTPQSVPEPRSSQPSTQGRTPAPRSSSPTPQRSTAQPPQRQREAQPQRSSPQPTQRPQPREYTPRTAPSPSSQPRSTPAPRSAPAPQPRSAPAPQPRSAPAPQPQRTAPQAQPRSAPQRQQPTERHAPERKRDNDKDDNGGRHR